MNALQLYLASASPRRRDLLQGIGLDPRILASGVDERLLRTAEQLAIDRGLSVIGALSKPFPMAELRQLLTEFEPDARKVTSPSIVTPGRRSVPAQRLDETTSPPR